MDGLNEKSGNLHRHGRQKVFSYFLDFFFFSTMGKKKFLYLYFISVVDSCEVFMWVLVPPSLSVVVVVLFVIAAST